MVHQLIELDKARRFVLTGSSARKLHRTGVDLLAGRAVLTTMHPFMAAELGRGFNLSRALSFGLIPLVVDADDPAAALRSYAALYVREEVQAEGLVRNVGAFSRFLEAVSFSHAAILNVSNLARECQVERKVAEVYVEVLRDLLLAFTLPVFTRRAAAHDHPSRLYLIDAGLFRSLRPKGPLDRAEELARVALEGLVAQHLRAWIAYSNRDDALSFWREPTPATTLTSSCTGESRLFAIKVKSSAAIHPGDFSGLRAFTQDYPVATPVLLYQGPRRTLERAVLCLPCEPFLRALLPERSFQDILATAESD